jgi:hypothetical protein
VPHGVIAAGLIQLVFDYKVLSGHHLGCHLLAPFEMRATPEDHAWEPDLLLWLESMSIASPRYA